MIVTAVCRNLLDIVDEVESQGRSVPPRRGSRDHDRQHHHHSSSDTDDRMNRSHDSYRARERRDDRVNSSFHGRSHKSKRRDDDLGSEATSEDELEESKVLSDIFFLK